MSPPCSSPAITAAPIRGTAIATAAVNAVIDEMQRIDAPAVARRQGQRIVEPSVRCPALPMSVAAA
jgi:hypothetical protein